MKPNGRNGQEANRLLLEDRAAHEWYRFILSFPPHLVRDYLGRLGARPDHQVLDPFCGTGTTLVECKKLGIPSVGVEANPMAHFASLVKLDWTPEPEKLREHAVQVAEAAEEMGSPPFLLLPRRVETGFPAFFGAPVYACSLLISKNGGEPRNAGPGRH